MKFKLKWIFLCFSNRFRKIYIQEKYYDSEVILSCMCAHFCGKKATLFTTFLKLNVSMLFCSAVVKTPHENRWQIMFGPLSFMWSLMPNYIMSAILFSGYFCYCWNQPISKCGCDCFVYWTCHFHCQYMNIGLHHVCCTSFRSHTVTLSWSLQLTVHILTDLLYLVVAEQHNHQTTETFLMFDHGVDKVLFGKNFASIVFLYQDDIILS